MSLPKDRVALGRRIMNYDTSHLKVDQFIAYLNSGKINLIPSFQRGHVWTQPLRRRLVENMILGKPIPAVFLYTEPTGATYAYNILDGKQRLESLILFIGNKRSDLKVDGVGKYFYSPRVKAQLNFAIDHEGEHVTFFDLNDQALRDFREYKIPTIEISLDDEATVKELIDLFVDINQRGKKVNRFDIVKALSDDPLLHSVLEVIATRLKKRKDVYYQLKTNPFTWVLRRLSIVNSIQDHNAHVDKMWELLVELFMFQRHKSHKAPVDILKSFIKTKASAPKEKPASKEDIADLTKVFRFLRQAYGNTSLMRSRLAANQIHFYTMVTALIDSDLLEKYPGDRKPLIKKLALFGMILDEKKKVPNRKKLPAIIKKYLEVAGKHTTHAGRRKERHDLFLEAIDAL